jgi:hypothetical protein
MATRRFSINLGNGADDLAVTEAVGAAVVTSPVEITVELANVLSGSTQAVSRQYVLDALTVAQNYILERPWPPA